MLLAETIIEVSLEEREDFTRFLRAAYFTGILGVLWPFLGEYCYHKIDELSI